MTIRPLTLLRSDRSSATDEAPARYRHTGTGEPVLLIHPFLLTREVWDGVIDHLAADHEVLAVTLPRHWGGAPSGWGEAGIRDLADALESSLDEHGWDTCHVVGNSLGGWLAFELERRGRARSVTAIAPAGGWKVMSVSALRLGATFLALAPVMTVARPFESLAVGVPRIQKAAMSVVAAEPAAVPVAAARRAMVAALRSRALLPVLWSAVWDGGVRDLPDVQAPTQLVLCDLDRVIPWHNYGRQFLKELPPHAARILLRDVGHVPMLEAPELVAQTVRTFLGAHAVA